MKRITISLIISLGFCSCAYHSGLMTATMVPDKTTEILRSGSGSAKTVHIFGIGGLSKLSLAEEAKKNLYANLPLKKGESYANIATNTRVLPWIFVFITEMTYSADVVRKTGLKPEEEYQEAFQPQPNQKGTIFLNPQGIWIKSGDQVWIRTENRTEKGTVQMVINDKKIYASSPSFGTAKYRLNSFFLTDDRVRFRNVKYKIGQEIVTNRNDEFAGGTIAGINPSFALVESGGSYFPVGFSSLDKSMQIFENIKQEKDTVNIAVMIDGQLKPIRKITSVDNGKNFNIVDTDEDVHFGISEKLLYNTEKGFTIKRARCKVGDIVSFKYKSEVKKGRVAGISDLNVAIESERKTFQILSEDIVAILKE